jgi:hypothetical protein
LAARYRSAVCTEESDRLRNSFRVSHFAHTDTVGRHFTASPVVGAHFARTVRSYNREQSTSKPRAENAGTAPAEYRERAAA